MSDDMIDEDLMKELGLDDEDLAEMQQEKKPEPQNRRPVTPPAQAAEDEMPELEDELAEDLEDDFDPEPVEESPSPEQSSIEADNSEGFERQVVEEMPIQLAVVMAKKSLMLKDVLKLRVGEVLEFGKEPGDAVDLVANGKLVAKAELVVVDGQLGVRIVKLIK